MPTTRLRLSIFATLSLLLTASVAASQGPSIKSVMKSWKPLSHSANAMGSGRAAYDQNAALRLLQTYAADSAGLAARLSPTTSQGKDMKKRFEALATDAGTATARAASRQAFTSAYATVIANCRSCHDRYSN